MRLVGNGAGARRAEAEVPTKCGVSDLGFQLFSQQFLGSFVAQGTHGFVGSRCRHWEEEILFMADFANGLPRKILGHRTPEKLFEQKLDKIYAVLKTA